MDRHGAASHLCIPWPRMETEDIDTVVMELFERVKAP
jgi:hypothetical protein